MLKTEVKLGICIIGLLSIFYFVTPVNAIIVNNSKTTEYEIQQQQALIRLEGNYREDVNNVNFIGNNSQERLHSQQSEHLIDAIDSTQRLLNVLYERIDRNVEAYQTETNETNRIRITAEVRRDIITANSLATWVLNAIRFHTDYVNLEEADQTASEVKC